MRQKKEGMLLTGTYKLKSVSTLHTTHLDDTFLHTGRTDLMWTYTIRMRLLGDHASRPQVCVGLVTVAVFRPRVCRVFSLVHVEVTL